MTPLQPGAARAAAEAILGSPVREWTSSAGVRYRTYEYDAGCPPRPGDAAALLFMNLATLGLWEVFMAVAKLTKGEDPIKCHEHATERVVVAYDDQDLVLGIFDEFAELPADGRSGRRKWE